MIVPYLINRMATSRRHDHEEGLEMRKITAVLAATAATATMLVSAAGAANAEPREVQDARSYVATIKVFTSGETYRVELLKASDVTQAFKLMYGTAADGHIPLGIVVRGTTSVNSGYQWHIDPATFTWADNSIEACSGQPHEVSDPNSWLVAQYCPWATKVVAVTPRG